jgi:hypothetical protein
MNLRNYAIRSLYGAGIVTLSSSRFPSTPNRSVNHPGFYAGFMHTSSSVTGVLPGRLLSVVLGLNVRWRAPAEAVHQPGRIIPVKTMSRN